MRLVHQLSRRPWLIAGVVFIIAAAPMLGSYLEWMRHSWLGDHERLNGFAQSIRVALASECMLHQKLLHTWRKRVESLPVLDADSWRRDVDSDHELDHSRYRAAGIAVWVGGKLQVRFTIAGRDAHSFPPATDLAVISPVASAIAAMPVSMKGSLSGSQPFEIPGLGQRVLTMTAFQRNDGARGMLFALAVPGDFLAPVETSVQRVHPDGSHGDVTVMKKWLPYIAEGLVNVRLGDSVPHDPARTRQPLQITFTIFSPTGNLPLLFTPGPRFGDGEVAARAGLMLTAGLLTAAMLATLVWTQARQRMVLAAEVRHRTAELENTRDELGAALDSEREVVRMKSQFVNTVSHEFRTPLGVILSSADILAHYSDRLSAGDRAQHLQDIQDSSNQMSRMLEQVLDLGRSGARKFAFQSKPLDLAQALGRIADESCSAHGGEVQCHFDGPLSGAVADESLLRHIVLNLLSNARKYSGDHVGVDLTAHRSGADAVVIVRDRGIGIPALDQPHVFETFSRASNATGIPGTGLGLAIVMRCVTLHGGTITLDSIERQGTTVTVRLPVFIAAVEKSKA